ncbi:hypothetical protein N7510_004758 [Penicillium lagena]|uniref:uncharacterized protein n=1 Tax=Penicillium lagena TaxID=94218 RepID=UPI002541061B|nr:uncharacterized protein N7510_004758 [Penicillium lagena]KAJ5620774.1 hypothetical protein N7510_004758 [Penicillium lagena]
MHKTRRIGRGRSRTGCTTCKARHIKCDEARQSCTQCLSSGRICEGYDFSSARLKLKQWAPPSPTDSANASPEQALETLQASPIQRYYFELFRQRLAIKCSSRFNVPLWTVTMLQASYTNPSILSVLVAISASIGRELVPISDSSSPPPSVFYQEAMFETRRLLSRTRPSLQTIVLCCIGLTTLEVLRCQYPAALIHLESCIKLLNTNSDMAGLSHRLLDREVLQGIMDLDHHASQYLDGRPPLLSINPVPLRGVDQSAVITDAFNSLETISRRILRFTRLKAAEYCADNLGQAALEVYAELQSLLADLSAWSIEYSDGLWDVSHGEDEEASFKAKLLLMQHSLVLLEASTSLYAEESAYDKFDVQFTRIVALADDLRFSPIFALGFSAEIFGMVKPLYVTALKCRNFKIRYRALHLLSTTSCEEGAWSSTVMGPIAKAVTELEERCRVWDNHESHIAERHRVHSVVSDIDHQNKTATTKCTLRPNGMDGEWETMTVMADWV